MDAALTALAALEQADTAQNRAAVSPATGYRVLKAVGIIGNRQFVALKIGFQAYTAKLGM